MRRLAVRRHLLAALAALAAAALAACASGSDQPVGDDDTAAPDARVTPGPDAADPIDATPVDGATIDGATIDGATIDATPIDATPIDATPIDAMPIDGMVGGPTDTCAQAQDLTAAANMAGGVTVVGDTTGYADDVNPASSCTGYAPDGPDSIYVVTLTAGQTVTATATPTTSWDISLELVTPCATTPTCLDGADSGLSGAAETATYTAGAAQTVYVVVDGYNPGVAGPYSLLVQVQ
ncbi:MAG: hypothetical protein H6709_09395 [Kofleriaceae bacterium]|nr:hypothetical protein [Myxococcales bacterium]MCB9561567.1 hypothetical protein [Kofleriaceae bacterium]MCB9572285.1 hypothetical protein [Kofleriaceae bacterium]